jgi:hypothetical protein
VVDFLMLLVNSVDRPRLKSMKWFNKTHIIRAEDFSLFFFGDLVDYFQSVWGPDVACFQSVCDPIWSTFSLFFESSK